MILFKLDISKINENIEKYINNSSNLSEQLNLNYKTLINVDSCWNDATSKSFIARVKKDGYDIEDYLSYLKIMYSEIEHFIDDINNVYKKYNYKNLKKVKYDNARLSQCCNSLDRVNELLKSILYKMNKMKLEMSSTSMTEMYEKINYLYGMVDRVNSLKNKLLELDDSIEVCLEDAKSRKNKIEVIDLNVKKAEYVWKISDDMSTAAVSANDLKPASVASFATSAVNLERKEVVVNEPDSYTNGLKPVDIEDSYDQEKISKPQNDYSNDVVKSVDKFTSIESESKVQSTSSSSVSMTSTAGVSSLNNGDYELGEIKINTNNKNTAFASTFGESDSLLQNDAVNSQTTFSSTVSEQTNISVATVDNNSSSARINLSNVDSNVSLSSFDNDSVDGLNMSNNVDGFNDLTSE